jgi:DNA polymerase III epsilon subunit-like protein
MTDRLYCSLDIETSGFDPLTNEILEVGFVFFKFTGKSIKITEEWTKVFKPNKPVSPHILGLTGISQQELDSAESFNVCREFIQEKLGKAVIVGHNINFDTQFLEAFGLRFSGEMIDTLDLVQWILPTHHSYNLENLMHTFGISHKEAHRALADSKATLKLLEKLLQVYSAFPLELKKTIKKLCKKFPLIWNDLLEHNFEPVKFVGEANNSKRKTAPFKFKSKFKLEPLTIYNFPLNLDIFEALALNSKKLKQKLLLVVPDSYRTLDLFRRQLIEEPIFSAEEQFDETKFFGFLKKSNLSLDETKFILKILVWKYTNWQTATVIDLNLSFFGGQFKNLITGGTIKKNQLAQIAACDMRTFISYSELEIYGSWQVIICGLNEFERSVTSGIGTKVSWGYINYLLKSFYNPENSSGNEEYKQPVEQALADTDLFFGLVGAMLHNDPPSFQYFKITAETEYEDKYQKIQKSAENYIEKMQLINQKINSDKISVFVENLSAFFLKQTNRVKWIELAENRCAFMNLPLDITGLVKGVLDTFSKVSFADTLDDKILPKLFINRLGLKNFTFQNNGESGSENSGGQGDLFIGLKRAATAITGMTNYHFLPKTTDLKELSAMLTKASVLPAAVLFGSPLQVRDFYEQNYLTLKKVASLLAQSSSGGSNKIFRNFSINSNGLLLATDRFVLKHLNAGSGYGTQKLPLKTLILCHLPFDQYSHPYQEAVSQSMPNAFEDYSLPRALYNFHSIIKFFYNQGLKDIFIIDSKLSKPYAKVFMDYYKVIPKAVLKM